jgi:hypothetical protein
MHFGILPERPAFPIATVPKPAQSFFLIVIRIGVRGFPAKRAMDFLVGVAAFLISPVFCFHDALSPFVFLLIHRSTALKR